MNFEEFFNISFQNLKKRRLRSYLTMLGIFIGIAAIVSLLSIGQGLQTSIEEEFEKLGADKIIIQPRTGFAPTGADVSTNALKKEDLEVVRGTLGVEEASASIFKGVKVEYNDQVLYTLSSSIPTDASYDMYKEFAYFEIEFGRDIKNGDLRKVVLGSRFADGKLFTPALKVRDKIEINDEEFKVVGIYESLGSSEDDKSIFVSEDAMTDILDYDEEYSILVAKVDGEPSAVAERVKKELRKSRNLEEGNEDFSVSTYEEFLEAFTTILNILNVFLIGIASISLVVGGIGIMNTMYTSVLERTQEIGVLKAIGARNEDVASLFLIESGLLGVAGGAIGVALGMLVAKGVEYLIALTGNSIIKVSFPWWLIIGALAFSFIVGSLSGVLPAIQASKLEPTEALRYE